jgi:hypothetical protein
MSHIIEEYAKSLGVKIGSPIISEHFYPLISDNYITFHTNDKKSPARHFDYWEIVFDLIKPKLKEKGIDIVQVGADDDPGYPECVISALGSSFKQMSYIVKGAKLHLGIDSLPVHLASVYDIPIVGLYSNLYPECSGPVWNKNSKTIKLAPDFSKIKPSFVDNENPKRVNEIKPEVVAQSVLELLNIENNLNNYKTLNIGKHFFNKITEIVPDFTPDKNEFKDKLVNLRFDYDMKEDAISDWLSRKCNLMINKPLDSHLINSYRDNIAGMTIFLGDHDFSEEYFDLLTSLNLNYTLISRYPDRLPGLRLKFFSHTVEEYKIHQKKDLDFSSDICDNTLYCSNKTLISNNKQYYSKAAWKSGIEKTEEHQLVIDTDDFWEEIQHLNIYNYAENKKYSKE